MNTFLRNTINKLYHPESAVVASTQMAFSWKTAKCMYCLFIILTKSNRNWDMKEHWKIPWKLKQKKKQDDDYEQYDIVPKMKLVYEGISTKQFRMAGNFNGVNTRMIITNLTRHIEMREKVSYSFNQRSIKVLMRL